MTRSLELHPDRLFPADPTTRGIARMLYAEIADLPIVSPHGHTDPTWFADDRPWTDATTLLLSPDHYLFRMLYSQGIDLDALAIPRADGTVTADRRAAWRLLADHYHLFRGTPSRMWLDHVFAEVFGMTIAS
jgi:glucuronate isomerase